MILLKIFLLTKETRNILYFPRKLLFEYIQLTTGSMQKRQTSLSCGIGYIDEAKVM